MSTPTPRLEDEPESTLIARAQAGDLDARNEVVRRNLGLVGMVAGRYPPHRDRDDLFQVGSLGLMEAVGRYDAAAHPDASFATYAIYWIRQEIVRWIRDDSTIRVSPHVRRLEARARDGLELSALDAESLRLGRVASETRHHVEDLDLVALDDPAAALEYAEDLGLLAAALEWLDPLEREVITRLYGLHGRAPQSPTPLAADLGCTRQTVRNVQIRALGALREAMEPGERPGSSPPRRRRDSSNRMRRTA